MRASALFGAKHVRFMKCMEEEPVRTRERRGQFFAILCGRPLWTASYRFNTHSNGPNKRSDDWRAISTHQSA